MDDDRAALVTLEAQLRAYRTGMIDHLLRQSRQGAQGYFALEHGAAISQLAGIDVRWNRPIQHRDRKSTRLNSSHVKISYAVFCLKKKKKRRQEKQDRS